MCRFLRGVLVVVGAAAFGLSAGALVTHALLTAVTGGLARDGWGAAPIWMLFVAIGGAIGLIVGLTLAISRIRNSAFAGYQVIEWLGLLLGIAAGIGLALLVPDRYEWFVQCIVGGVTVPTCATMGRWLLGDMPGGRRVARSRPVGRRND